MRFETPQFLWLLLLVPALLAFFAWAGRVRRRLMTRFIQARLLPGLLVDVSPVRRKLRAALLLLAVLLLALVVARPQWGFHLEEVKQRGLDIVVALDTSRSMLAADTTPTRLARAKLEALALKQLCKTDRIGLVAFAGTAFLQCPLTLDDDAFRQSLEALDTGIIPQGGTALAEAIRTALTAFKEKTENHRILVLFTDGEDHDGQAVEAAEEAAKQGMRIFTIGVGTPNGELLKTADAQGRPVFIKDTDGNVVKSRLNEPLLREIATVAGGFYLPLAGARTMDTLHQQGLAPLPKSDSEVKTTRRYHERFQWFLGFALVLLLAEMFLPDTKQTSRFALRSQKTAAPVAALLAALLVGSVSAASAPGGRLKVHPAEDAPSLEQLREERLQAQRQRENQRKINRYDQRLKKTPADARLHFNKGTLESENGAFAEAEEDLKRALNTPDLRLQSRAYYNLGNTLFRRGEGEDDLEKKKQAWQQATNSYAHALQLDPKDDDARYNFDLVGKKIAALPQPPPQPQNQDKKQDQDKDKDDQSKQDQQDQSKKDDQQQQQQQQNKGEDQQKKEDQQSQQQKDQQDKQQEQQKQDAQQQQQGGQNKEGDQKDDEQDAAPAGKLLPMTPQQARQLLDALKNEEKTLIFTPPTKTNRTDRLFKDW